MAFTVNMTDTNAVDDSILQEFDAEFRISLAEQGVMAQLATLKRNIGAESISLPKYNQLALATTPLVEDEDVDSEKMSDSKVILTPEEYGKVVTKTSLASIQTGGAVDRASAKLVGINAGRTENRLAMLALDASSNVLFGGSASDIDAIGAGDIMTGSLMGKVFNKLGRANAIGVLGGDFAMVAHDDVIFDLRENSAAGSWEDISKNANPELVLRGVIGYYKGFKVIRDNLSTITVNTGGIPVYNTYFVGYNALGEAVSLDTEFRMTDKNDRLARFVSVGWYCVKKYGIVEQEALWVTQTASGANA